SRPTVARVVAAVRFGRSFSVVCRGGPWHTRETLRHRGVPGTMQASSPTGVCYNAGTAFSRLAAAFAVIRRGGFHIRPGCLRRRRVRRDEGIPPYGRLGACCRPVWPVVFRGL